MSPSTVVHAGSPWPEITKVCAGRGPRRAAIAFVGEAAPAMLPLTTGDALVVNADDSALLAHATHPDALAKFVKRGVAVYSHPRLHAKVLATRHRAVIGSANASANSAGLREAVTVSSDAAVVAHVKQFVDELIADGATVVDELFLGEARKTYARGRGGGPPGADGGQRPTGEFLRGDAEVLVIEAVSYVPSRAEWDDMRGATARVRRAAGPAARYALDILRWDDLDEDQQPRVGDAVVYAEREDGDSWLAAPRAVIAGPRRVPYGRGAVYFVLKQDRQLQEALQSDVEAAIAAAGVKRSAVTVNGWQPRKLGNALLGAWGLDRGVR